MNIRSTPQSDLDFCKGKSAYGNKTSEVGQLQGRQDWHVESDSKGLMVKQRFVKNQKLESISFSILER